MREVFSLFEQSSSLQAMLVVSDAKQITHAPAGFSETISHQIIWTSNFHRWLVDNVAINFD